MPDDYAPEVLVAYINTPLLPDQGPDLISGVVTMDDAMFTTLLSLASGFPAISRFICRALLGTRSPQPSIHQGTSGPRIVTGASDVSYVRSMTPRSWSGFGSRELLSTHRQTWMTIEVYHHGTLSASLAPWMCVVPNETIRCPLLLGRKS